MNRLNLIWHKVKTVALFLAFWLALQAEILAAPAKKAAGGGESTQPWLGPYALVIMAIGLGMVVVCRSSRRSDRAKPKEYQSLTDAT